jgi:hypothetical protein
VSPGLQALVQAGTHWPLLQTKSAAQVLEFQSVQPENWMPQVCRVLVPEHWVAPSVHASLQDDTHWPLLHTNPLPQALVDQPRQPLD